MSADPVFDIAVANVLRHEGGYANNAADPGGETNCGICKRDYPGLDIAGLSADEAKAIYYRDFWLAHRIVRLPGVLVPVKVMDTAVVCGAVTAIMLLQRALSALGARVAVDGAIGPLTVEACRSASPDALLAMYRELLLSHFEAIVASHPEDAEFLPGWKSRALT